jgi:LPS sulfotransferase NodH
MLILGIFGLMLLGAVVFLSWLLMTRWLDIQEKKMRMHDQIERQAPMAALKISACERLTIMLERSTPTSTVMRMPVTGMNAAQLQLEVIKSIRQEFEHNVGLQIYVNPNTWQAILAAREETIDVIKLAFQELTADATAIMLSQRIFLFEAKTENAAIQKALEMIKEEISQQFEF